MEEDQNTQFRGRFGLPTVLAAVLLVGLLGFSLGANFDGIDTQRYGSVNEDLPEELDYERVDELYGALREKYAGELSEEELMEGLKKGLVGATGDSFTQYLDADSAQELDESLDGQFGGIGAEIGERDGNLVVIAPISGTPADEAGLQSQDVIAEIDGQSTVDLSVGEAVSKIRGEEGTEVVLTIVRGDYSPEEVEIIRGQIEVPSVESEMLDDNVGYIELIRFGTDTTNDFRLAANSLLEGGAEKIVLDVRSNPGGFLEVAVDVASEFLSSGDLVVEERRGEEVKSSKRARGNGLLSGVPTVVLINEGSASASEIIAGALRDNGVADLVGMQTFGKGSVQELVELSGGSVLRVTIANWYTPDGVNIEEEGVKPDFEVELDIDDIESGEDPQLDRALEVLR